MNNTDSKELIRTSLNFYKKSPFIALLSYDEPENNIVCAPEDAEKFGIEFQLNAKNKDAIHYYLQTFPISFKEYKTRFDAVRKYQERGENSLLNLCFATKIETNLTLREIYKHANADALIHKQNDFICFSPEPFVTIKDGFIHTFPMKGTIDASIKNARQVLLNDEKELREQEMMVELMKKDLSGVSTDVEVKKFRYIQKVNDLYQTSSHVRGRLKENLDLGDIFSSVLPAGSITGSPKQQACTIIKECEKQKRGFYTGVFIHFNGRVCKSFVMIRFVKKIKNELYFFSGGGITTQSDAKKEYEELIKKIYFPF